MRTANFVLLSLAVAMAAPLVAGTLIAPAEAQIDISIGLAPPPVRIETPPPPPGPPAEFVWQPGHWRWDGHQHVWHAGVWAHPPAGYHAWVAPHWDRHPDGHWSFVEGYWR